MEFLSISKADVGGSRHYTGTLSGAPHVQQQVRQCQSEISISEDHPSLISMSDDDVGYSGGTTVRCTGCLSSGMPAMAAGLPIKRA
jgi:hypothetical protein